MPSLSAHYFLGAEVGIARLLFAGVGAVHGVILLQLHRLHFLLDRVHFGG